MLVLVYHKTDVLGLQTFLWDKFAVWASNGKCVEEIWKNFKGIVYEGMERFVPHKLLRENLDPEYYNKEVKRLKSKVRKAYNGRRLGDHHLEEMKRLSRQLLAAKKSAQETFFRSVLNKEGKCCSECYKYVKKHKGHRENIPTIKDCNGWHITEPIEKANSLNFYYSSVFSGERDIPHTQCANSGESFITDTKVIRKRVAAIRKKIHRARQHSWRNP